MNCKLKLLSGFLLFCVVAYFAVKYVPPEWGGYGAMILFLTLLGIMLATWLGSAVGHIRNPYDGAQRLRHQARKIAADDGVDINTAAQEVWGQAQAKGQTYPKREMDTLPRPVMADRAHIDHIRHNEPMPLAGYDRAHAKEQERFGVVQQPELPAGNEVEGIWVDVSEKQHSPIGKR